MKRLEIQALLQRAAVAQNLPPSRFMSHSLRIGGASALFQATGEIETVKRAGRWSSSTVQRYLWDGGKDQGVQQADGEGHGIVALHVTTWTNSTRASLHHGRALLQPAYGGSWQDAMVQNGPLATTAA